MAVGSCPLDRPYWIVPIGWYLLDLDRAYCIVFVGFGSCLLALDRVYWIGPFGSASQPARIQPASQPASQPAPTVFPKEYKDIVQDIRAWFGSGDMKVRIQHSAQDSAVRLLRTC